MNSAEERLKKMIKENEEYNKKNHIDDSYVPIEDNFMYNHCKDIQEILNQNQQLKDNWNKLEEWLKEEDNWDYTPFNEEYIMVDKVLNKMQEKGGSNE